VVVQVVLTHLPAVQADQVGVQVEMELILVVQATLLQLRQVKETTVVVHRVVGLATDLVAVVVQVQ
jgi:hypothetical protein